MRPWDFYRMTYKEYLLTFMGYQRAYYLDYSKHRSIAYQMYLSQPRGKGDNVISIYRYMPLPTDENHNFDTKKVDQIRAVMLAKIRKEKDGKRSKG